MDASNTPETEGAYALEPKWIRVAAAVEQTGISRTKLYGMMNKHEIRYASLADEGQTKATRLICYRSLMDFIEARAQGGNA